MNKLVNENTKLLIAELLNEGIEHTRKYITDLLNEYITDFNDFIKACHETEYTEYSDNSYTILELYVGDDSVTKNMLCINYNFSTTDNNNSEKKCYSTTHGYISLVDNTIYLFQFGPSSTENRIHQEWLDNLLSREYKFKQLGIKN